MPTKTLRVAVLFGGRSSEHEVSIRSAASVIANMDPRRYEAIPVAIDRNGRWLDPATSAQLLPPPAAGLCGLRDIEFSHQPGRSRGFDVVFPVLHGPFGEDGKVQGLLDLADVPYVGSGVLGSACGMDKDIMKRLFHERGVPTLRHVAVEREEAESRIKDIEREIRYPAFVKPANLGSSVGIRRVAARADLVAALAYAGEFDRKILVEPAVEAREIECSVLGCGEPKASLPGEIVPAKEFYDYEAKYESDETELIVPAQLSDTQLRRIQDLAVSAFLAVNCEALARIDFFLERGTDRILVSEVNTMPGFTSISMFPKLWEASGVPYAELIDRLLREALERSERNRRIRLDPK